MAATLIGVTALMLCIGLWAPADFHNALHRVRAGLFRGMAVGVERDACVAHAIDEYHQRRQRHHYSRWLAAPVG